MKVTSYDKSSSPVTSSASTSQPAAQARSAVVNSASNSDVLVKAKQAELQNEIEAQKQRLRASQKTSSTLDDNDMEMVLRLTDSLRVANKAIENAPVIESLKKSPGYDDKSNKVGLFVDALPALDMMHIGKLAETENMLKPIVESPVFDTLSYTLKERFLKCYGDALYKQNKIEQANRVYERIKNLPKPIVKRQLM